MKSLFELCKNKVRQFPELEKQLFHYNILLYYEFAYQKIIKRILHDVSTPHLKNNKSFERYFRKLVQEHIYDCGNVNEMLHRTQTMLKKIKQFRKIYGVVADIFEDLHFLEYELKFMLLESELRFMSY